MEMALKAGSSAFNAPVVAGVFKKHHAFLRQLNFEVCQIQIFLNIVLSKSSVVCQGELKATAY